MTFARVPLIFAWLGFAVAQEFRGGFWLAFWACAMMLLSGLTDAWDGKLARKWGVVSTLGKMADPLMDKVFYIVAFPALVWQIMHQGESDAHALVMMFFTILYMLRDTWVTFLRSVGALYGADVGAMWLGKVRTALSFPAAGYIYLYLAFRKFLPQWFAAATASQVDAGFLWSVYAIEAFLIGLNIYSCAVYTKAYWPYMIRAIGAK